MPVHYRISPKLNLVVFVHKGAVTGNDLLFAISASFDDPLRVPGMLNILDMFDVQDELEMKDLWDVLELEKKVRQRKEAVKVAVLSWSDGVKILASAMTLMSGGTIEAEVFNTVHDASAWLGIVDEMELQKFLNESQS